MYEDIIINSSEIDNIYFTLIQSVAEVVKTYYADGTKKTAANIFRGRYYMQSLVSLRKFDEYLNSLTKFNTISIGITTAMSGDLVTNNVLDQIPEAKDSGTNKISRSKRFFKFLNDTYPYIVPKYSLYVIDIDFDEKSPLHYKLSTPEEVRNTLVQIAPFLNEAQILIRPSSSSNIMNLLTGKYRNETKSFHVYIIVANSTAETISNFNEYLKRRCFVENFAYVTTNGIGVVTKFIFDFSVPSPERLIVESVPTTYYPYQKILENSVIYEGGILDLSKIDYANEPDYKDKVELEKLKIQEEKGLKISPEKTKTSTPNFCNVRTLIPSNSNLEIIISDNVLSKIEKIYVYLRSDFKRYDIKKINEYLDRDLTELILNFLGYEISYDHKFKMRNEATPSTSIRDDGLIKDFGNNWSGRLVNFIMDVHDLDFKTSFFYIQNLFGKSNKIKSKTAMLPNPKDFEKCLTVLKYNI